MSVFIKFDKIAAQAEIAKILDASTIKKEIGEVLSIDWGTAFQPKNILKTAANLWDVVQAVTAAVEVLKNRWKEEKGAPMAPEDAANLAIDVLDAWIQWTGWAGKILEAVDARILRLIVEFVMHGKRGADWLATAKLILGIA